MKFDAPSSIADALDSTLEAFTRGDFERAEIEAEKALSLDFEEPRVQAALKCAVYWKERAFRAKSLPSPEARGDFFMREWSGFDQRFRSHLDVPFEQAIDAIRATVLQWAAQLYVDQVPLEDESRRTDLLLKASRTWKRIGDFDQALEVLDQVLQSHPDSAAALGEMADCLDALGEEQKARLFFREAFYVNAQQVELETLRCGALLKVISTLHEQGLSGLELKEWIPVYAVVSGVFTIKRELKPLEVGQLKQGINSLKSELHDGSGGRPLLLPRLINRYFWLIDHFLSVKEDRSKIEDILLNIKLLDAKIYDLYTH